jgi:hypothetical protein
MINLHLNFDQTADKQKLYKVLTGLKGMHMVEIKKFRKRRSNPQNNYYFKCIVKPLADEFGYFPEEMHHELKRMFNPVQRINKLTGEVVVFGGTTTGFDTLDAELYYEKIRIWALSEYSILLLLPNEQI